MLATDILRAKQIVPPVPERRGSALRSLVKEEEEGDRGTEFTVKATKRKRGYVTSSENEEAEYDGMEDDGDGDDTGVQDEIQGGDDINVQNQKRDEDAQCPASPRKHDQQIKVEGGPTTAEKRAKAKLLRVSITP